jgi:hypothetical protein
MSTLSVNQISPTNPNLPVAFTGNLCPTWNGVPLNTGGSGGGGGGSTFTQTLEQQFLPAGTTLVTLTTATYQVGSNNLSVFANGVRLRLNYDYNETSSSSFTLTSAFGVQVELDIFIGSVTGTANPAVQQNVESKVTTAGQTVIPLTSISYTPGSNNLTVFANGIRLRKIDDYLETNASAITLVTALPVGTEIDLVVGLISGTGSVAALQSNLAATTTGSGSALVGSEDAGGYFTSTTQEGINQELGRRQRSVLAGFTSVERTDALSGSPTIDTTTKVQAAIDSAASAGDVLLWEGTVLTGLLSSSSNSIRWKFNPGAKILQKVAVYAANSWHVTLSGNGVVLDGIDLDGNQSAMTNSTYGSNGLNLSGTSPMITRYRVRNYNGVGYNVSGANAPGTRRGLFSEGICEGNAGVGLQTIAASFVDFIGCWHDRNGYGFQKTRANYADTTHGFVGFGVALRLRSHHITFLGGGCRDNGRDGLNVNQGSYAIKHIGVLCHGNDDGGFTIASDSTGSGLPGEGEACYDIEYTNCESYNNYTSGLVAYQPTHNVTVSGGRYYNNHRLAGNLAAAASYCNGIYFAAGSTGISVNTKTYDERQSRIITASSSGVLTATGWVAGTMNYYPKVVIYDGTGQTIRGYGKITAESAGSVTIATTSFNGVTLSAIAVGDYVTQAVQHAGVSLDNNCQGVVSADGFGHRGGVGFGGYLVLSGANANGQNVLLPQERHDPTELITNSTFDAGITNWTTNLPTGASATAQTTAPVRSAGGLKLIGGTSAVAQADSATITGALAASQGAFVEGSIWCYASARGDATLYLFYHNGSQYFATTITHPGGGWRLLRVGGFVPPGATATPFLRVEAAIGKTTYWDSSSLKSISVHADNREYSPVSRTLIL